MFPENRYVRDRNERNERNLQFKKADSESTPIHKEASVEHPDPKDSSKSLSHLEKRSEEIYRPLPGGGGRNLNYKGLLSQKELDRVEKNYPVYKAAEMKTGINWKILAAVHYRESSLGKNTGAKGNEYQFDGAYKSRATGKFYEDTITAGKILQEKVKIAKLSPLLGDEFAGPKVQRALLGYNGLIYKTPEHSPYVMNQFDETHQNMKIYLGPNANPRWGVDHRLGAYTVIKELTRAFY